MWVNIILRSLSALIILFLMTRVLGKKQISQLSFFEYVLGITLGELAGFISTDIEAHYIHGFIALLVWFIVPFTVELLTLKSKLLRHWFEGKGRIIIKNGKIMEDNLKKERLTADELLEQLRGKSVFNMADVEFAVMETNGELSVLLKKDKQPLTASQLGVKLVNEVEPQTIIIDGNIMDEPLSTLGLNRGWLNTELEKIGITVENVFIGQVDAYQQLYVDLYDDKLQVPAPQSKALLLANMKKLQADLELFALSTRDKNAKRMYAANAARLDELIAGLKPALQG
ncbi:DUF421 domain-containing protein [Paenibacillus sp. GCM10012307]|uniref:DUF421 domain-containing protein n=1 Tax=Paenibacillus roseus TaxID=2798579 RepID=A0A934JBD2_9BACL|nr:DUF421 domain-containing protein [Paenibacillus roseus]MBJ6363703.1 DUF421 domain-containing protein [Paenibacillus roseus]